MISVLIYTARVDHPYVGKAETWHCFEPFLRTLSKQTFRDFELVLVDALYETRGDYFETHPQPFAVKHVPSRPNYWQERGRPGLSAQLNRGFIWADGETVWMGGENNLFPPHHLELVNRLRQSGKTPVAWYGMADRGFAYVGGGEVPGRCPASFELEGFTRDDIHSMDHRAARFLDSSVVTSPCHHHNYFGYSSVALQDAIAVNGFDELMDGNMALQDCDMGGRLKNHGCDFVMHRDLFVIEPPTKLLDATGYGGGIRLQQPCKCNYAILLHNELTKRRANTALPPGYVADVQERVCRGACGIKEKCVGGSIGESKMYPFCAGEMAPMADEWFASYVPCDLVIEREKRKRGEAPYDRAHVSTRSGAP